MTFHVERRVAETSHIQIVAPVQPEKESMLSSWQQDSPLVREHPEEYCMDNVRVVVLHVNVARKTWNATCSCLEPSGKGYSCRHILCVALQLDPVRFRHYHMDLSMFNVIFCKTKGSVGLCVSSYSTARNPVAGAAQLRARQKAAQQSSILPKPTILGFLQSAETCVFRYRTARMQRTKRSIILQSSRENWTNAKSWFCRQQSIRLWMQ